MNDSNTQHLSDLIKMFYERTKGPDYQYEVRIVQSWEKVVGKFIASHTTDIFIRNGILHVRIDSDALRNELSYSKSVLMTNLNQCVGREILKEIVFT